MKIKIGLHAEDSWYWEGIVSEAEYNFISMLELDNENRECYSPQIEVVVITESQSDGGVV